MAVTAQGSAILSVADKTHLEAIAKVLRDAGIALYSTGGTAAYLRGHGIATGDIADLTGTPAILSNRVKALHPAVFAGLMAREEDAAELATFGFGTIDYLIAGVTPLAAGSGDLAGMDIGGPAMIRAAVKTNERVVLGTHPDDYSPIIAALREGGVGLDLRRNLARRAMERLMEHDASVLSQLEGGTYPLPQIVRSVPLRYGENPHQTGTLHLTSSGAGAAVAEQLQGKTSSFTNVLDADTAFELARQFEGPAAVIVKHGAPCGVALKDTLEEAYLQALATDPQSAFGCTVGLNRLVDESTMKQMVGRFTEAVVAPGIADGALAVACRRPTMRILRAKAGEPPGEMDMRGVTGGILVQTRDRLPILRASLTCVTQRRPSEAEIDDMLFALEVSRFVKSNAAVTAQAGATIGIGGGQSSRVGAVEFAVRGCKGRQREVVLASDAYFPFPDSVEVAAEAGVTSIVQQGGAKRDAEVIAAANRLGVAMMFSGIRLFRH